MKILIDAMGGDNAPDAIVKGAVRAAKDFNVEVIFLGNVEVEGFRTIPTTDDISCDEEPVAAVKHKKDSSIVKGLTMLKNGEGDAFVSAGSTGALMAGATLYVKRIKGIKRMALSVVMPLEGKYIMLIDGGANVDCKPEYMVQFGIMGATYLEQVFGIENPRVGLLNIGTEEVKGDERSKDAFKLLNKTSLNFVGNIEAREALSGYVDVIVSDGFSGNILLKGMEGAMRFMNKNLKKVFKKGMFSKLAALMVKGGLKEMKKTVSFGGVGGAPLLGADGTVIKAHGNSDADAIYYAVKQAIDFAKTTVNEKIREMV